MAKNKASLGRQKIAMVKIQKKNHLDVTFSKRRAGLFKKASELCTLCGVEIAIVVFSPANKAFSFGHPQVEDVIDHFLYRKVTTNPGLERFIETHRSANIYKLNTQLTQILVHLEDEKKKGEVLGKMGKGSPCECWREAPIEELGLHQLVKLKDAMEELKKKVGKESNMKSIAFAMPCIWAASVLNKELVFLSPCRPLYLLSGGDA